MEKKYEIIGVAIANKLIPLDIYDRDKPISYTYLLKPNRHHDVIKLMYNSDTKSIGKIQGFIDQDYNFMTRKEAYSFALKHDLITNRRPDGYNGNLLYSECMW